MGITSCFERLDETKNKFLSEFLITVRKKIKDNEEYEPNFLRATASKYRESADSKENSDFLLLRQKDPFFKNILSKLQRVHVFVKSRKVQNTAQSTIMADGIYPK